MIVRSFLKISPLLIALWGGLAFAQEPGSTSRPESDTNVQPSTAIQKQMSGRASASEKEVQGSSKAGAPGIEGKPGTQSGQSAEGQAAPARRGLSS
jgi:hypothetical protein